MVEERGDFLLESVEGGETRGRYSLLGLDPDLVFRAHDGRAQINRRWRSDRRDFAPAPGNALEELRALVEACRIDVAGLGLPPALACLVGYFGYETIGLVEQVGRAAPSELDLPDMLFVRPGLILVFDGLSDDLFCIAPLWPDRSVEPASAIAAAVETIDAALRTLDRPAPPDPRVSSDVPPPALEPAMPGEDYTGMVARAKEYIAAGDVFQVVLAQRFTSPFELPPLALYRALRRVNPSPFLYLLDLPGFAVVGSSPEILVRVRDDDREGRAVTIRPIAGTRPRGVTREEDMANEAALLADPKERAEHLMLLDLGRNDVGRVATPGSVEVTDSFAVERYSHVMHIVSNVVGSLAPDRDSLDALLAGFPCRHGLRCAEDTGMRDHRRARARDPGRLCRRGGLFRAGWVDRFVHRPAHGGGEGRRDACTGGRRDRRGQ